jgi:hypothetical protein
MQEKIKIKMNLMKNNSEAITEEGREGVIIIESFWIEIENFQAVTARRKEVRTIFGKF